MPEFHCKKWMSTIKKLIIKSKGTFKGKEKPEEVNLFSHVDHQVDLCPPYIELFRIKQHCNFPK